MPQPFKCPKCSRRAFTLIKLIQHIGLIHAHEANFTISCGIDECCSTFVKFESYRRHVYRKHRDSCHFKDSVANDIEIPNDDFDEHMSTVAQTPPPCTNKFLKDFKENLFNFVLKCREKNLLPISVQKEIVDDVNFLLCFFKENYDTFISYHLEKSGFDLSESPELARVIQSETFFKEATEAIQSSFLIKQHCKETLNMTEPVDYKLHDDAGHVVGTYSYVPIDKVLQNYYLHDNMQEHILSHPTSETDVLADFCDGEIFQEHPFFKDHPNAVRLHFYEDEFEVVNPLGSKRTKHKLCAFYYTIGNLDKRFRSHQRHIHLALLVRYSYVKQCGWSTILKPMLDDLKKLAIDGFTVSIDDHEHIIHAALATISCDNLSAHMLGGFTCSFNSGRICRYCMATYGNMKHLFKEDDFILRTSDVHKCHLARVQQIPDDRATYGVYRPSPFEELDYFDTTTAFPPDVMHDLLEGVIPLVMKLVISKAHAEKHVTIREINEEMNKMCFGQNDKVNKPVQLSERLHIVGISGSASQKWCLFRLLPFLLAQRVPNDCTYWNVFLLCREIVEIVMAPKVRKDSLLLLNTLVEEFLMEMKNVFGDVITPKCHYLTHYARLMQMYGPLRLLWCMRYEGKHQYFKKVAFNCRNFVNIASTLSRRHQFRQCWEMSSHNMFQEFETVPGKCTVTPFVSLPIGLQKALTDHQHFCHRDFTKPMQRVSQVTVNCVKYAVHDVFVIGVVHSERIPMFLKIKYILNADTQWILCGKILFPKCFDFHFYSYTVSVDEEWIIMYPGEEIDYQAYDTYSIDNNLFVTMRHSV